MFRFEKRLQVHAGKYPALFFAAYTLARKDRGRIVGRDTDLLIEGFPRSANSFAVSAFRLAQRKARKIARREARRTNRAESSPGRLRIANNLHVPAQVIRAASWGIPTLVLIRDPKDAIVSFQIRDGIPTALALKYYASFYETVEGYRNSFVLGRFEEVTTDFGAVVERVNARFGTAFAPFEHTKENVAAAFARIDKVYRKNYEENRIEAVVSRPSSGRKEMRRALEGRLLDPAYKRLLARAEAVHERLVSSED